MRHSPCAPGTGRSASMALAEHSANEWRPMTLVAVCCKHERIPLSSGASANTASDRAAQNICDVGLRRPHGAELLTWSGDGRLYEGWAAPTSRTHRELSFARKDASRVQGGAGRFL